MTYAMALAGFFCGLMIGCAIAAAVLWHVLGFYSEQMGAANTELMDRLQAGSLHEFKAAAVTREPRTPREVVRDRTGLMTRKARREENAS